MLCGMELPWVNRAVHLGIALTEDGDLLQDCKEKRAQFIDKSAQIRETFGFAHSMEKVLATEKYCINTRCSPLGFDKHRSTDGLPCMENRHKNCMGHSKVNTFLFGTRSSHHRVAELGTKNS